MIGGDLCENLAPPWACGSIGSVDLFNTCGGPSSLMYVPANVYGYQEALTGNGYAGIITKSIVPNYREYLMIPITPLTAGTWYYLSFYVSLSDMSCGIEHFGAYFSVDNPYYNQATVMPVTPQIETDNGFITDTEDWVILAGCFQAAGGEQYMVVGNFRDDVSTPLDPHCNGVYSFYYMEDFLLVEGNPPEENILDLGGPETACFSYEIVPENPGPVYYWSDGSHMPTLTVNESGVYALTVSDGCTIAIDSIEVIIGGNDPPVDLGPDQVEICNGDAYMISLDPELSEYTWNDGSNDSQYTIVTSGTYAVTLDDGCVATSDEITVDVLDVPEPFDLGDDFVLCVGDELVISLDPSSGDFIWQDGSTASEYIILNSGVYALTISNICGEASDEILVTDLDIPEIEIGPDDYVLCNGEILEIEIDPGLGTILWQDGTSESNYEISTPGVYQVSVTNQCGTGIDQVTVSVLNSPVVDIGSDTTLCSGDMLLLSINSAEGIPVWQDNSTGIQYQVTTAGTYAVTVYNICGSASDTIDVDYIPNITPPDFGPDVMLCPGEQIVLYAGNPTANHLWQDMSTEDSLLVTGPGTYTVTVSTICAMATDTIVVTYNNSPPVVALPAEITLCQGENFTLDATVTGVSYLWNDNSEGQQLEVNAPGMYSVTVTNACGTDVDTTIVLDGGPPPSVTLGNDLSICPGDIVVLSPSNSNVDTWLWQDGSSLSTYTIAAPGMITVEVSNTCSSDFDTLLVTMLPVTPPLDLGADTSLCVGQSFTLNITTPDVSILWPDGSTGMSYNVSGPGTVYASVTNLCGVSTDTIEVVGLPGIPNLNLGVDQTICPGELVIIDPGISGVDYVWQDGSTASDFQTTLEDTIILTITNTCGSATDTLVVTESTDGPQLNLGPDIQACVGESITIEASISGVQYLWQDGSTTDAFITTQSGIYMLTVSNACGSDADTVDVEFFSLPPKQDLGRDTLLCEGTSIVLIANAGSGVNLMWQDQSSGTSYLVTAPGIYSVKAINQCGEEQDSVEVSYLAGPDPFDLGPDTIICAWESVVLSSPSLLYDMLWQDGSMQPQLMADQAGIYTLTLSNDCGTVFDELEITINNEMPVLDLEPVLLWCPSDQILLDATQPFPAQYQWSTGAVSPSVNVNAPGMYTVQVFTTCYQTSTQTEVLSNDDCKTDPVFYIPNVFSPNGDGINDVFIITSNMPSDIVSMEGRMYDRWGSQVYSAMENPFSWNGQFDDKNLNPGVYVYVLTIRYQSDAGEVEKVFSGDVTLIR